MAKIFHIMEKQAWLEVKENDYYSPSSLGSEGFIHCSKADQVLEVANRLFKGQSNLVILKISELKVHEILKYETPLETPQLTIQYPHLYGPLKIEAIEKVFDLNINKSGNFELPKNLMKSTCTKTRNFNSSEPKYLCRMLGFASKQHSKL